MITTAIGITQIVLMVWIVIDLRQIRMRLDRQGVERYQPAVTQPTSTSWLATDALQAAQEQAQTRAALKIANAVKWR